jgi:hypothetical protein
VIRKLSAREAQIERYRMQIIMAHLCAGGDLGRWIEFEDDHSPEEVGMIEEAAFEIDLFGFLRALYGSDFGTPKK